MTQNKKQLKIFILNDEDVTTYYGGAAIVNEKLKDELIKRGHDVTIHRINQKENTWNKDMSADLYIIANWAYIPREDLDELFENKPYIKFYHDIPAFMYSPKTILHEDTYQFMQKMFNKAKLNIFISSFQHMIYSRYINTRENYVFITPPPKNMDEFENKNKNRQNRILYLGDISRARGIIESVRIAQQHGLEIDFVGKWVESELVEQLQSKNYLVLPEIDNEKVPELMNKYKYFIYMPLLMDSFCLKILEAELCGCEIIADFYKIGRFTYNNTIEELKDMVNNAHITIVDKIEKYMNK